MPNDQTPKWKKLWGLGLLVALVTLAVVFRNRLHADFWPLDSSRVGPNIVASIITWLFIGSVSILLYPPWRRAAHRFIDNKLNPIHTHLANQHKHNEWTAKHLAEMYEKHTGKLPAPHPYLRPHGDQ